MKELLSSYAPEEKIFAEWRSIFRMSTKEVSIKKSMKNWAREWIWSQMEKTGDEVLYRYPRPIHGRFRV
ncbi:Hypothetical protein FKW44_025320 [Caligus rogercresseyi]|uniref:Uncharacterized protein n=1 Tax=Caligus rogercresseyi TaxID=217165 RepID=A0A7T8JTM6_CALRO|nr:Hypothetical protein FKW44_025320 [Caligus rogercresseyi]